ncbi:hypothetical protein OUZ56_028005 [Daphnia magna]|uniref:Uncharacterized protein n=1 Tax=Daphnia magna TaxID=35525 RepID=A0ABR0B377_9CRUS|nr:hypothetical protein OUZ56_028005 [Daphnia magna]
MSQDSSEEPKAKEAAISLVSVPVFLELQDSFLIAEHVPERCEFVGLAPESSQILEDHSKNPEETLMRSMIQATALQYSPKKSWVLEMPEIVHPRTMALLKLRRDTSRGDFTTARVYLRSSARVRGSPTTSPATGPIHQGTR